MSEHLFEKENTVFERDILFSLEEIKLETGLNKKYNTEEVLKQNEILFFG